MKGNYNYGIMNWKSESLNAWHFVIKYSHYKHSFRFHILGGSTFQVTVRFQDYTLVNMVIARDLHWFQN